MSASLLFKGMNIQSQKAMILSNTREKVQLWLIPFFFCMMFSIVDTAQMHICSDFQIKQLFFYKVFCLYSSEISHCKFEMINAVKKWKAVCFCFPCFFPTSLPFFFCFLLILFFLQFLQLFDETVPLALRSSFSFLQIVPFCLWFPLFYYNGIVLHGQS